MTPELPLSVDIMARTIDGEAEGCGVVGMHAVANVIINRVRHPRWWGHDVLSVCRAPWQFSCWVPGPDRDRIAALSPSRPGPFQTAINLAEAAIGGKLADITGGADSYYAKSMAAPPAWAERGVLTYTDAWHRFYRTTAPGPAGLPDNPCYAARVAAAPATTT